MVKGRKLIAALLLGASIGISGCGSMPGSAENENNPTESTNNSRTYGVVVRALCANQQIYDAQLLEPVTGQKVESIQIDESITVVNKLPNGLQRTYYNLTTGVHDDFNKPKGFPIFQRKEDGQLTDKKAALVYSPLPSNVDPNGATIKLDSSGFTIQLSDGKDDYTNEKWIETIYGKIDKTCKDKHNKLAIARS